MDDTHCPTCGRYMIFCRPERYCPECERDECPPNPPVSNCGANGGGEPPQRKTPAGCQASAMTGQRMILNLPGLD